MRTGIVLPTTAPGTTGEQILDWARSAEERGFDTLGVIDRVIGGVADDGYDAMVAASMAAAVTKSIELIAHKLISPLGSGTVLATQAWSLERASGGQLTLALGIQHFDHWIGPGTNDLITGSVAATADAVRAFLRAFEQAGADDVLIAPRSADRAQLDLIADAALRAPALI